MIIQGVAKAWAQASVSLKSYNTCHYLDCQSFYFLTPVRIHYVHIPGHDINTNRLFWHLTVKIFYWQCHSPIT